LLLLASYSVQAQEDALQVFARAEQLRKSNNFIAAIDEFDRAIALEPANPRFYFSKGMCYFTLKEHANAILAFQKTVELKSDIIPAYTMMAKCYQAQDRFIKVEESLNMAFKYETDPERRIQYKEAVISILYKLEKYDMALKNINEAKVVNPDVPNILYYEASIQNQKGNYQAARQAMERATAKLPSKDPRSVAKFYYELGYAYNKLGEYEKSNEAFKYANVGPFKSLIAKLSPQFYVASAMAYMQIYDFEKATELLNTALEMQSNYSRAHVLLSNIAQMKADQSEAIAELQKAASVEEDSKKLSRIYQQLSILLLENEKYNQAVEVAQKYQQLDQKNYEVIFVEAVAHKQQDNLKQAISIMERLVNFPGLSPETKAKYDFALGLIYKSLKNYTLAKGAFKHAQSGSFKTLATMEIEEIEEIEKEEAKKGS